MPFPNPATHGPDEAALVRTILANHAADLPKLVYADWLEERNDPRGSFLRAFVEATADGSPYPDPTGFSKPWLDLMGVTALIACRKHAIPIPPAELLAMALPAIRITAERVGDDAIPVGASKFGGGADVPDGFEWPMYGDQRIDFLAQFDLAEVAESPAADALPSSGLLSVFYFSRDKSTWDVDPGGWHVCHFTTEQRLKRSCHRDGSTWDPAFTCTLTFTESLRFPNDPRWALELEEAVNDSQEVVSNYATFWDSLEGDPNTWTPTGNHTLLGWPIFHRVYPYWFEPPGTFRHLLTLDTDEEANWRWGRGGSLYFGTKSDALRAGDFSDTIFEFQN